MQVPDNEVAIHVVPESCVVHREVWREALKTHLAASPMWRYLRGCDDPTVTATRRGGDDESIRSDRSAFEQQCAGHGG